MSIRRAQNDNTRFHIGFLSILTQDPTTQIDVVMDRLDVQLTDATFQAGNGRLYRKVRASSHSGVTYYGSAFAGPDGDFTKSMTLSLFYGQDKLTVPVPIADLAGTEVTSMDLSCSIPNRRQAPPLSSTEARLASAPSTEDHLWQVTEALITAKPIREEAELTRLRRAVTLIHHPDGAPQEEREVRTRILARANNLIDQLGQQLVA